jgi:integrase
MKFPKLSQYDSLYWKYSSIVNNLPSQGLKAKCGYGGDYVFHSFRKGVATQLETGRVPENVTARLLGHDLNTMSYGLYSGGVSFDVLSEAIEHLSWG